MLLLKRSVVGDVAVEVVVGRVPSDRNVVLEVRDVEEARLAAWL